MKILPDAAIPDEIICGFIGYACGSGRLGSGHDSDKRYKKRQGAPATGGGTFELYGIWEI